MDVQSVIENISILGTQNFENITAVPIKTDYNYKIDFLTLEKGLEMGLVEVKEVSESGVVGTLLVVNNSISPLILFEGDEVVGSKQNRIITQTTIIEAKSSENISVNCTERGRWLYTDNFRKSNNFANHNTRSHLTADKFYNKSSQMNVWREIDELQTRHNFRSDTSSMAETYEKVNVEIEDALKNFNTVEGQNGIIVFINGEIKGIEIFYNPSIYEVYHEKILKSYIIDRDSFEGDGKDDVDYEREIHSLLSSIKDSEFIKKDSKLGEAYMFKNESGIGSYFSFEEENIQLQYLTLDVKGYSNDGDDDLVFDDLAY
ncbi:ARPP-1 family domain-containing protein [uncultured Methanobrevibacter sp.]|uniref:ARPP-1 family domain-containing protein n=1 Tax=uncultured Methanobrevibacter sp. TaxID=253161 RepID=UPI002609CC38